MDLITRHGDLFDAQGEAMLAILGDLAHGSINFKAFDSLRDVNHQINVELVRLRMANAVLEARCESLQPVCHN